MKPHFTIRLYEPSDQRAVEALAARVEPYRPEDAAEVDAMQARAARARDAGDGWSPPQPEPDSIDDIERWYPGFWVAVSDRNIVGMVGVRRQFLPGAAAPRDQWHLQDDIAELRRLRVAPEAQRAGIGWALTNAVIDWCRADGCRVLYLHTTSAQSPARALYERLGFRDFLHAMRGDYESVWYALEL
jgi:ribosomal protein S18 acetylase RimI-like enzyme